MSHLALYIGFVVAVAAIVAISQWVWHRQIKAMPSPPNWVDAWRFLWCECYLMAWESQPRIVWVKGASFRCSTGGLVAGETDGLAITVAVPDSHTRVSATALAHEAWHAALHRKGLNADAEHLSAAWRPNGAVENANARLRERGW